MDSTSFCVEALSELFYSNLVKTEDFEKHMQHCSDTGWMIIRAAFIKNIQTYDEVLVGQVPSSWKILDSKKRTLITLMGLITYTRRIYEDEYGCRRYLLDEVLGVTAYKRIEKGAFLWIVYRASDISYAKTARAFFDKTGVQISKQTVKRCVDKAGELLAESEEQNGALISNPVLFCEFDGFYVNLQSEKKLPKMPRRTYKEQFRKKSREFKVWTAYAGKKGNKRLFPFHWASDEEPSGFFTECMRRTARVFDLSDVDFLVSASDAATWCKSHGLDAEVYDNDTVVVSRLDVFHVNQRVYRAFSSEDDRSFYLKFLYSKKFAEFFSALEERMDKEPDDERQEKRADLYSYISNNLDWLEGPSLSKLIRDRLISELPAVFGDRGFYSHLHSLLSRRRYKRFIKDLGKIVASCAEHLRYDYECFLEDAKDAMRLIAGFGRMSLGTMEGTNSKVYAARLKVWGCAWSVKGALAMMRIRAAIASGVKLIAPKFNAWLTDEEKSRIEAFRARAFRVPEREGRGWEPPQGSIALSTHMAPKLYGWLNYS